MEKTATNKTFILVSKKTGTEDSEEFRKVVLQKNGED